MLVHVVCTVAQGILIWTGFITKLRGYSPKPGPLLLLGIVLLLAPHAVESQSATQADDLPVQQDENNCHDPEAWADWNEKAAKWREDKEFQALHALRIGLCVKVERGHLTVDEATAIFENARHTLIQKRREERRENQMMPAL